ncbi:MAG TPA: hypothetical protein VK863_08250, partial [Candidatus Limnocylindrales bacterium]|nr:hypothetical protein [Candidatus Limnocylindrales bacterium]
HTLIDFTTHVKGVEYIISVLAITGYILYVEILKPKPFKTLAKSTGEDLEYLRKTGFRGMLRTAGRIAAAPFIGLAYVIALPFIFAYTLVAELLGMAAEGLEKALGMAGRSASFGWRPMEAYFGGKKERKKEKAERQAKEKANEKEPEP